MADTLFKSDGNRSRDFKIVSVIVHLFALLHALVCHILRSGALDDGWALTILTIIMVVLIINFFKGTTDVFLSLLVISSLAGFYLGTNGAVLISYIIPYSPVLTHVISTFAVTEILGWLVYFSVRKPQKR